MWGKQSKEKEARQIKVRIVITDSDESDNESTQ